jgi:hypothetical protein
MYTHIATTKKWVVHYDGSSYMCVHKGTGTYFYIRGDRASIVRTVIEACITLTDKQRHNAIIGIVDCLYNRGTV